MNRALLGVILMALSFWSLVYWATWKLSLSFWSLWFWVR